MPRPALALIALLAAAPAVAAECGGGRGIRLCDGCVARTIIVTDVNTPCSIRMGFRAGLRSITIVRRARHGIAGVSSNTFGYAPARDFRGDDSFSVRVEANERTGGVYVATIEVEVQVR